jgi:hypothetical protein
MLGAMPVRALSRAVGRLLIKVGVWLGCCQGERALESLRKPLPARGSARLWAACHSNPSFRQTPNRITGFKLLSPWGNSLPLSPFPSPLSPSHDPGPMMLRRRTRRVRSP